MGARLISPIAVAVILYLAYRLTANHSSLSIKLLLIVSAAAILAFSLYFFTSSVHVDQDRLVRVWFGIRRTWPRSVLGKVTFRSFPLWYTQERQLIVVSKAGKRLFGMWNGYWADADLLNLAAALGYPQAKVEYSPGQPNELNWIQNHPNEFGMVGTAILMVIVLGMLVLTGSQ
jgi:hypothetical protein